MKFFISALLCLFIVGCSSTNLNNSLVNKQQAFYELVALPKTVIDKNGEKCAHAKGHIEIIENKVIGTAKDNIGRIFNISGKLNNNKNIMGGFAISEFTAVGFDGELSADGNKASGTWIDLYDCKGVWTATKI